jgi:hypothetical protein
MSKAWLPGLSLLLFSVSAVAQTGDPDATAPAPAVEAPEPVRAETSATTASAPVEPQPITAGASATENHTPLSPEELEALGFGSAEKGLDSAGIDTELHVSGFADFSVVRIIVPHKTAVRSVFPVHTSYYIGNFNLYLAKNLAKTVRTMGEVRFLYEPNGNIPLSNSSGTPTTSSADHNDFGRPLHWGGVEIERLYIEWAPHPLLTIRVGQFLTPYGIWNVDHGSVTYIPVERPFVIGDGLFPERQTGFELYGRWDATAYGTLGYHLTLSNGEGPISEYRDLDNNKAVGGRLFWEQHGKGDLKVGFSTYYGRNSDVQPSIKIGANGKLLPTERIHVQYDSLAFAVDAAYRYKGLTAQVEWISQQRRFVEAGRALTFNPVLQRNTLPIDALSWGTYLLVGYRFNWFGVMPYVVPQYVDSFGPNGARTKAVNLSGGLNIRPIDSLVVKLEYGYAKFLERLLGSNDPVHFVQAQVAWAF